MRLGYSVKTIYVLFIRLWAYVAAFLLIAIPAVAQQSGEIVWEDEGFASDANIPRNIVFDSGGVQATLFYDTISETNSS